MHIKSHFSGLRFILKNNKRSRFDNESFLSILYFARCIVVQVDTLERTEQNAQLCNQKLINNETTLGYPSKLSTKLVHLLYYCIGKKQGV